VSEKAARMTNSLRTAELDKSRGATGMDVPRYETGLFVIKQSLSIRILDVVLATVFLISSVPVMTFIALLIMMFDGWPVLFRQVRYGVGMREITILKFRTMRVGAENFEQEKLKHLKEPNVQTEDDDRITWIGKILRRLSLDELPELFLVLRGQMSLVGPRPLIKAEVQQFPSKYLNRFSVLPGVTGLAQVSGRSKLSVWDILDLDLQWVESYSLSLYLRVVFKTVTVVLRIGEAY
jgi:lipopolysaccharide/colanic/teichoic acid biosynthesis glycosyltransferase